MNSKSLVALSLLGILSGAQVVASLENRTELPRTSSNKYEKTPASSQNNCGGKDACGSASTSKKGSQDDGFGNKGYYLMTEKDLLLELNQRGYRLYLELSDEGKELARKVASARCNGTNLCKNLNACKTEKNGCAGKGSCKNLGKCAFSDKNQAVQVVYDKLKKEKQPSHGR